MVTVDCVLTPINPDADVTATFTKPNGTEVRRNMTTATGTHYYDYEYVPDVVGNWIVEANWQGDETFEGATSGPLGFEVAKANTMLTLKLPRNSTSGNPMNLTVILRAEDGKPIVNAIITFSINEEEIGFEETDAQGIATISYTPRKEVLHVKAVFEGNERYSGNAVEETVEVSTPTPSKIPTPTSTPSPTPTPGPTLSPGPSPIPTSTPTTSPTPTLPRTKILEAVADTFISNTQEGSGIKDTLTIGYLAGTTWRTYILFDLSDIPPDSSIQSIKLKLKSQNFVVEMSRLVSLYQSSSEWTETGITWDNKPEPEGSLAFTKSIDLLEEWYYWEDPRLTTAVENAFNKGEKLSIVLCPASSFDSLVSGIVMFYSRESENGPKLEICHSIPEPTPTKTPTSTLEGEIDSIETAMYGLMIIVGTIFIIGYVIVQNRNARRTKEMSEPR
jgi:hypothetical protein